MIKLWCPADKKGEHEEIHIFNNGKVKCQCAGGTYNQNRFGFTCHHQKRFINDFPNLEEYIELPRDHFDPPVEN